MPQFCPPTPHSAPGLYWINRYRNLIPSRFSRNFILESLNFLLKNNIFEFIGELYRQLTGTAMGATFASFYACLTIGYLEETKLHAELFLRFNDSIIESIIREYKRFMDDGIVFLPSNVDENEFLECLNNMNESITFTIEKSNSTTYHGKNVKSLNFLDICIILHEDRTVETDIHYKTTNAHDYLHFNSFHPPHIIKNVPYNLAKRIIVFVSNEKQMDFRLDQLRKWLVKCNYPPKIINKSFHNAKLQGPAGPPEGKEKMITYVHPYMSNYSFNNIIDSTRKHLQAAKHNQIKQIFSQIRIVEAIKQPKNIIRMITNTNLKNCDNRNSSFDTPGLYAECKNTRCNLCHEGYIQECTSFLASNNETWNIKSHINCNSKNVLYFLVCNMCRTDNPTSKTGKTWTKFRDRLNNHISDCKTANTTDIFDLHVHECGIKNQCFKPPYFKVYAFMKLAKPDKLLIYEKYLHDKGYATINS